MYRQRRARKCKESRIKSNGGRMSTRHAGCSGLFLEGAQYDNKKYMPVGYFALLRMNYTRRVAQLHTGTNNYMLEAYEHSASCMHVVLQ